MVTLVETHTKRSSQILSPIDGSILADVAEMTADDVDSIFAIAAQALPSWSATTSRARSRILNAVADLIDARSDAIADLETLNTGKLPSEALRDVGRAAECFRYYAGWADKATGDVLDSSAGFHTFTRREPFGIAVGIIPWNSPFVFAAKKIAPALAFGNVSILKPASETPLTALFLLDLLIEAGLPVGACQIVTGGVEAGQALTADPRADLIVFTGSDATGREIARSAASNLTPTAMELGGKSPQLVFADADLQAAVTGVIRGIFSNAGQMCIAGSRAYVDSAIYSRFLELLTEQISRLRVGDPRIDGTDIGPQATRAQQLKTRRMIDAARSDGARVLKTLPIPKSPQLRAGFWVEPTVLADVPRDAAIMRDEVFGPVLCIGRFDTEAEAIERAHETAYGLSAGVWTSDVARAHRVANALHAGTVWINAYRVLADSVPFGGMGQSGYGREGGPEALHLYTQVKSVWVNLSA